MNRFLVALLLIALPFSEQAVRYDNYKVYRITAKTEEDFQFLSELENINSGYNLWSFGDDGKLIDIMVAPYLEGDFSDMIQSKGLKSEMFIENVQERIDNESPSSVERANSDFDWSTYRTLDEIHAWLKYLAEQYPETVSLVQAGQSYEGREILGVHVSYNNSNILNGVFVEGGIHAREWISPMTVTYILNELLTSNDSVVRDIAESHDWYVFPSVNPDGYVYSHTTDRLWRKTRTPYSNSCYGADPNRNWDFEWNTGGASNDSCKSSYAGPFAFSEAETKSLSDYITGIGSQLKAYLSFHSYGQHILIPYGAITVGKPSNYDELLSRGQRAAAALSVRYGTNYTVGNLAEILYVASGNSMDWAKGVLDIELTYVYELRGNRTYGFLLPTDQIIPTGQETLDSIIDLLTD